VHRSHAILTSHFINENGSNVFPVACTAKPTPPQKAFKIEMEFKEILLVFVHQIEKKMLVTARKIIGMTK